MRFESNVTLNSSKTPDIGKLFDEMFESNVTLNSSKTPDIGKLFDEMFESNVTLNSSKTSNEITKLQDSLRVM